MTEWYKDSFGEDYLIVYKHRDVAGANREVHQMISWLDLPKGARVLDLCCGMGRHSIVLAQMGYKVTGVDLSKVLLQEASHLDEQEQVEWVCADMRNLPLEGGYDAVVNLFTSFGYFRDDQEQGKVLHEIRRILKPDGQFIIDYMNPSYVIRHLVPHSVRSIEGLEIEEHRKVEDGYVSKQITLRPMKDGQGDVRTHQERVKLYTYEEFMQMLQEAGLHVQQVHGSYQEDKYDEQNSPRMIFVGYRKE